MRLGHRTVARHAAEALGESLGELGLDLNSVIVPWPEQGFASGRWPRAWPWRFWPVWPVRRMPPPAASPSGIAEASSASKPRKRSRSCRSANLPKGPLQIVVSIGSQHATLYSNGMRVEQTQVSTGTPAADAARRLQRHREGPLAPLQSLRQRADVLHAPPDLVGRRDARRHRCRALRPRTAASACRPGSSRACGRSASSVCASWSRATIPSRTSFHTPSCSIRRRSRLRQVSEVTPDRGLASPTIRRRFDITTGAGAPADDRRRRRLRSPSIDADQIQTLDRTDRPD